MRGGFWKRGFSFANERRFGGVSRIKISNSAVVTEVSIHSIDPHRQLPVIATIHKRSLSSRPSSTQPLPHVVPKEDTTPEKRTINLLEILTKSIASHIRIDTNPYELDRHGRGESFHPTRPPAAIVYPTSLEDVVQIVKCCQAYKFPLIPFGVGTSVEGHVCALAEHTGTVSLDTSLLQSMDLPEFSNSEEDVVSWPDPMATVGAGVTRNTLNTALRHTGLQFVVDPGADATLGGMVATGASGTTAVHYGTMRDNVLALTAVMPDGSVVQAGTKALKNSAGYDLLGLMCGSEGTLGVITSITVKLHPIPDHVVAVVCAFKTLHQAAQAVAALKFQHLPLTRCELLDTSSVAAFNQYNAGSSVCSSTTEVPPMEELPTLFLELQASSDTILQELVTSVEQVCLEDCGGQQFQQQTNPDDRKALWAARHQLYYASIALRPEATSAVLTDACVPLSEFARILEATARDVAEQQVVGPIFGHAGDGNFHCILPIAEPHKEDPDYLRRVHAVNDKLIRRTLEVGGTCTGEHGIGYGKSQYLERQYGAGAVDMMRSIKQAVDPHNIMNPGKVIPAKIPQVESAR